VRTEAILPPITPSAITGRGWSHRQVTLGRGRSPLESLGVTLGRCTQIHRCQAWANRGEPRVRGAVGEEEALFPGSQMRGAVGERGLRVETIIVYLDQGSVWVLTWTTRKMGDICLVDSFATSPDKFRMCSRYHGRWCVDSSTTRWEREEGAAKVSTGKLASAETCDGGCPDCKLPRQRRKRKPGVMRSLVCWRCAHPTGTAVSGGRGGGALLILTGEEESATGRCAGRRVGRTDQDWSCPRMEELHAT